MDREEGMLKGCNTILWVNLMAVQLRVVPYIAGGGGG